MIGIKRSFEEDLEVSQPYREAKVRHFSGNIRSD